MSVELILDSGAFSAWRLGDAIDLRAYIEYVKRYGHLFKAYVCLDTIPGSLGRMDRSAAAIEASAAASYRNQQVMRDAGLSPIPVFHQGERYEWLERYLADGEPYVGISPYLNSTSREITRWLDQVFSALTDARGRPLVRTHGFGVSHPAIIGRYPWCSVDSTSWNIAPSHGLIRVAEVTPAGALVPGGAARLVYVGGRSDASIMHKTDIIDAMTGGELEALDRFLAVCGLSVTGVRYRVADRMMTFLHHYKMIEAAHAPAFKPRASFARRSPAARSSDSFDLKITAAASLSGGEASATLNRACFANRLISYYLARKSPPGALEAYVRDGTLESKRAPRPARAKWSSPSYADRRSAALISRFE